MRKYLPLACDLGIIAFTAFFFRAYAPFAVIEVFDTRPTLIAGTATVLEKRPATPVELGFLSSIGPFSEEGAFVVRFSAERPSGGSCLNHTKLAAADAAPLERNSSLSVLFWHDRCLAANDIRWGKKYRLLGWLLLIGAAISVGHAYGYSRRLKWSSN